VPPTSVKNLKSAKLQAQISSSLFLEIVETINQANTLESLFKSTMDKLPVTMGSYHHFPSVGAFDYKTLGTFHGYNLPPAIETYYKTYDMRSPDPGIVSVFANGGFVWLSDIPLETLEIDETQTSLTKNMLHQMEDALCIPLFGNNNRRGYMFVVGDIINKKSDPMLPFDMQALANLFHLRFCLLIQNIQRQINLTPREAEVTELLTYGKTNQDIADILGISVSTVSGYVKKIFLKLEVSDRVSASMRAQSMKAIF